jgi:hypothetical protein
MTEPAATETAPEQSFSDYMQAENAKEDASVESAPAPVPTTEVTSAEAPGETAVAEPSEPAEPVNGERNADGTFKAKNDKVTAKGEWKRNQQLTAQLRETERQLEQARQARQSTDDVNVPRGTTSSDPSDPEPQLEQFLSTADPYAALIKAQAKWEIRESHRQAQQSEARSAVDAKVATFAEDHPDYHEKVSSISDVKFPDLTLTAIAEDDLAPAIAYHLASHPEEARRIAALRPTEGVKAIGRLVDRLTAAPTGSAVQTPPKTKAQPLIKPVSAAPIAPAATDPDPETTPFSDWVATENRKDWKRRQEMRGA